MKKTVAIILVIALIAAISVGVTLAYLTDRDAESNVFTMGNVSIDLSENFANGTELMPGTTVTKPMTITNTGDNDAWVWYTIAVKNMPAQALVYSNDGGWIAYQGAELKPTILKAGESATVNVTFGINPQVDVDPQGDMYLVNAGVVTDLQYNVNQNGNPVAYMNAYGIQAENFDNVQAAFDAYVGQWGALNGEQAAPATVTKVATAEELTAALAAGGIVVLQEDLTLEDQPISIAAGVNSELNLNGHTLSATSTSSTTSNLIKVNKGGTLTVSEGTVSFLATKPDTDWDPEGFPGYANNTISLVGTLIVDGATIENKTAPGGASYAIDCYQGATLIINSGKIDGHGKTAIRAFANSGTEAVNITVNGGEITGSRAFWIQLPSSNAAVKPPVTLTVNGGTLKSTNTAGANLAIYSYSYGMNADGTTVNLNGGTIYGNVAVGAGEKVGRETVNLSTNCTVYGDVLRYVEGGEESILATNTTNVSTPADFADAAANGGTIVMAPGTYTMPSVTGAKEIAIVGTKDTVIDNTMGAYLDNSVVSFEGVTIKGSTGYANGNGSDYAALYTPNVTYTNCTFDGPFRVGRDGAKFINCTFTNLGNDYVWTYGNDCTFIGCTFETDGKALLIYSDGGNEVSKVTVTDCVFNATASAKAGAIANQACAAIEIHNYGNGVDLTTSGNTIDTDFSGEWRIKTYEAGKPQVFVNGVEYTTIAVDGKTMTIDANKNVTVNG